MKTMKHLILYLLSLGILLVGCMSNSTIENFFDKNSFNNAYVAIEREGKHAIAQHRSTIIERVKSSKVISKSICTPHYQLTFMTGSSFENQLLTLDLCQNGVGVIKYMHKDIYYIESLDLYSLVESEFLDSMNRMNDGQNYQKQNNTL